MSDVNPADEVDAPGADLSWMHDAPRRFGAGVASATVEFDDGSIVPSLTFVFLAPNDSEPPITVSLIADEDVLRVFQAKLDKAITQAVRQRRGFLALRSQSNGKGKLWKPNN